eukprot:385493-Alexandrium_andersonii.AAC.1
MRSTAHSAAGERSVPESTAMAVACVGCGWPGSWSGRAGCEPESGKAGVTKARAILSLIHISEPTRLALI